MSTTPNTPETQEAEHYDAGPSAPRWVPIVFVLVLAGIGYLFWSGQDARKKLEAELAKAGQKSDLLAARLDKADDRIAELKGKLDVTSEKLGLTEAELDRARQVAQTLRGIQKASDAELMKQIGKVRSESEEKLGKLSGEVTGAKGDIEATRKDLEATKGRLDRAMGDMGVMSGLIARNREDVEELRRRGDRNYFEFDLRKSNTFQKVGPIQLQLKKVDTKKLRYTLQVFADDNSIEKKDRTVNEPVQFYMAGARVPCELVVFKVSKDRAEGYLSTPKDTSARKP